MDCSSDEISSVADFLQEIADPKHFSEFANRNAFDRTLYFGTLQSGEERQA
jgi:hypothetical protein